MTAPQNPLLERATRAFVAKLNELHPDSDTWEQATEEERQQMTACVGAALEAVAVERSGPLVERVAKAISQWMDGWKLPFPPNWERLQEGTRKAYREQAQAALAACEFEAMRAVLAKLVELKDHKEKSGKTFWYEEEQPKAWEDARSLLARQDGKA